jgi:drug/metabolite transporter (DMT)-like permease
MNIPLDIFAALGAMIAWGFGDFIIQKGTRKIGDVESLAWIGLLGSIGLLPFVWHDLFLVASRSNFLILLGLGIVSFVTGLINFESFKRGKLSVVDVILEVELPVAVLLGIFFFHNSLSFLEILLIIAVFTGIVLIAVEPGEIKRRHFVEKGAVLALVAAGGYALVDFLTAIGAKTASPLLAVWFPWVTFTIICVLYLVVTGRIKHFFRDAAQYKALVIGMGVIDTIAWVLFAIAVRNNQFAITVAITESYPAVALMLGVAVNREKVAIHQYIGAAIAVAASFAMGSLIR